jgi:glycosyltransferase involved in cell wall biosynthesis
MERGIAHRRPTRDTVTIDIMMPFYGRTDHFKQAVESVLAQTDPDWRLVILDDVYPDPEPEQWAAAIEDSRVTYIRNETNLRTSGNFQKAVSLMKSEFAVIMGCDDIMLPDYVGRLKQLVARFPSADVIQPGVEVINEDGGVYSPLADQVKRLYRPHGHGPRVARGEVLARSLLRGNWAYFPSLCWRTTTLAQHSFRLDFNVVQDLALLLEITLAGGSLVIDDIVVFQYRRHAKSVSAVTGPDGTKFVEERALFRETEEALRSRGWMRAARAARIHFSSRMHALADLPGAVRAGNLTGAGSLIRHVLVPN